MKPIVARLPWRLSPLLILLLTMGWASDGLSAPVITEFMAVNSNGIEDDDGDRSDWIELYNPRLE